MVYARNVQLSIWLVAVRWCVGDSWDTTVFWLVGYKKREVSRMTPRFLAQTVVWMLMSFTGMGKADVPHWRVVLWCMSGRGGEMVSSFLDKLNWRHQWAIPVDTQSTELVILESGKGVTCVDTQLQVHPAWTFCQESIMQGQTANKFMVVICKRVL